MRRTFSATLCAGVLGLTLAASAMAAEPVVLRVLVVQTDDVPAYVREVTTLQEMYRKAGVQLTLNVWRATYAGAATGTVIASIEMPNIGTLGKLSETLRANPDIAAEMKKIGAMRKVVSDSLYDKLTQ